MIRIDLGKMFSVISKLKTSLIMPFGLFPTCCGGFGFGLGKIWPPKSSATSSCDSSTISTGETETQVRKDKFLSKGGGCSKGVPLTGDAAIHAVEFEAVLTDNFC